MLEPPHYRPKVSSVNHTLISPTKTGNYQLFKTIHDQFGRAGEEEDFPESDNASKLKRSCENAEHVGETYFNKEDRKVKSANIV